MLFFFFFNSFIEHNLFYMANRYELLMRYLSRVWSPNGKLNCIQHTPFHHPHPHHPHHHHHHPHIRSTPFCSGKLGKWFRSWPTNAFLFFFPFPCTISRKTFFFHHHISLNQLRIYFFWILFFFQPQLLICYKFQLRQLFQPPTFSHHNHSHSHSHSLFQVQYIFTKTFGTLATLEKMIVCNNYYYNVFPFFFSFPLIYSLYISCISFFFSKAKKKKV